MNSNSYAKQHNKNTNLPYKAEYNLLQYHEKLKHSRVNALSPFKDRYPAIAFWWESE